MAVSYVKPTTQILSTLNRLINISGSSLRIKKLVIKEPYRDYELRPQLHLLISAPFGELKSTVLKEVTRIYPAKIYTHITFPSLVGSIDRSTKQIIPAATWECRHKIMILDEYTATKPTMVTDVLLQLLEDGYYSRKIATYSADLNETDGDLFFRVKSGSIEVKTRFACLIATMKNVRKAREYIFKALLSRCIPICYKMTKKEIDQVLDGKRLIKKEVYKPRKVVKISTQNYMHIRKVLDRAIELFSIKRPEQILARAVGDCCRCFAVLGRHDERLYQDILLFKAQCL
jgi:hypothetical protein